MHDFYQLILTQVGDWAPKVGMALLIALGFWLLSILSRKAIQRAGARVHLDLNLTMLFVRVVRLTLMVLGVVTVLGTLGVNVQALAAGLGLTGFALGFALKDTISNLLAGILILLYRPFQVGDNIQVAGFDGAVDSIDLRYTVLVQQGKKVLIPNARLFTDPVTVVSD